MVGGSAIEVHAPGIYRSGDLDLVIERASGNAARLAAMGIQVIPVTWRQLTQQRVATALRIGSALLRAELG